jgi:hypothetical protein
MSSTDMQQLDVASPDKSASAAAAAVSPGDGGVSAAQASSALQDDGPSALSHHLTQEQLQPLHISMQVAAPI